jgi:hypothetical protein
MNDPSLISKQWCGQRCTRPGVRHARDFRTAPSVIVLEWTDPLFSMGNWGPELVEAANGRVLLGEKGQYSQAISWDAVREADPEQGGRAWQRYQPSEFAVSSTHPVDVFSDEAIYRSTRSRV